MTDLWSATPMAGRSGAREAIVQAASSIRSARRLGERGKLFAGEGVVKCGSKTGGVAGGIPTPSLPETTRSRRGTGNRQRRCEVQLLPARYAERPRAGFISYGRLFEWRHSSRHERRRGIDVRIATDAIALAHRRVYDPPLVDLSAIAVEIWAIVRESTRPTGSGSRENSTTSALRRQPRTTSWSTQRTHRASRTSGSWTARIIVRTSQTETENVVRSCKQLTR